MTIITRPTKTGGGTDVVAGNDVIAQEWNDDLNTIYADYNGNITDANCSPTMGLQGSKLADAPNGISTAKLNDSIITTAKYVDASIIGIKLAAGIIGSDKLKNLVIESVAFSQNFGAGVTPILASVFRFTSGANYIGKVSVFGQDGTNHLTSATLTVTPITAIPTATKNLIALYLENVVISVNTISGNAIFVSVDKT